jgi:hypothetical protein
VKLALIFTALRALVAAVCSVEQECNPGDEQEGGGKAPRSSKAGLAEAQAGMGG